MSTTAASDRATSRTSAARAAMAIMTAPPYDARSWPRPASRRDVREQPGTSSDLPCLDPCTWISTRAVAAATAGGRLDTHGTAEEAHQGGDPAGGDGPALSLGAAAGGQDGLDPLQHLSAFRLRKHLTGPLGQTEDHVGGRTHPGGSAPGVVELHQ